MERGVARVSCGRGIIGIRHFQGMGFALDRFESLGGIFTLRIRRHDLEAATRRDGKIARSGNVTNDARYLATRRVMSGAVIGVGIAAVVWVLSTGELPLSTNAHAIAP